MNAEIERQLSVTVVQLQARHDEHHPQVCRAIFECYRDETFKLVKSAILVADKRRFGFADKLGQTGTD